MSAISGLGCAGSARTAPPGGVNAARMKEKMFAAFEDAMQEAMKGARQAREPGASSALEGLLQRYAAYSRDGLAAPSGSDALSVMA